MDIKSLGVPSLIGAREGLRREVYGSARYIDPNALKEDHGETPPLLDNPKENR